MIRRPPRSTLFPYTNALPIYALEFDSHPLRLCGCAFFGSGDESAKPLNQFRRVDMVQDDVFMNHIRSEEHTSELQSQSNLVCRLLLEKKKKNKITMITLSE